MWCNNREYGCLWEGELGNAKDHHDKCDYAIVACMYECHCTRLLRRDLEIHEQNACPRRPHECELCSETGEFKTITKDHPQECKKVIVECPNIRCNQPMHREDIERHRSECDFEPTPCKFAKLGCEEKEVRKKMKKHEEDSKLHLQGAKEKLLELMQTVEKQDRVITSLSSKVNSSERISISEKEPFILKQDPLLLLKGYNIFNSPPLHYKHTDCKLVLTFNVKKFERETQPDMKIYVKATPRFLGSIKVTLLNQTEDQNHTEYECTQDQWSKVIGEQEAELNKLTTLRTKNKIDYCGENVLFKVTVQRAGYKSWLA